MRTHQSPTTIRLAKRRDASAIVNIFRGHVPIESMRVIGSGVRSAGQDDVPHRGRVHTVSLRPRVLGPRRPWAERPHAGVHDDVALRRPQPERVDVPRPMRIIKERPRVGASLGPPIHIVARALVLQRQRREPLAQGDDLEIPHAEHVV